MTDLTSSEKCTAARARNEETFNGTRCYYDGSYAKNTDTGKLQYVGALKTQKRALGGSSPKARA